MMSLTKSRPPLFWRETLSKLATDLSPPSTGGARSEAFGDLKGPSMALSKAYKNSIVQETNSNTEMHTLSTPQLPVKETSAKSEFSPPAAGSTKNCVLNSMVSGISDSTLFSTTLD